MHTFIIDNRNNIYNPRINFALCMYTFTGSGSSDLRSLQLEWDPSKGLVLGNDVLSESVPGVPHIARADSNQTAQQGSTAFLPCRVRHLAHKKAGRKVSPVISYL